MIPGAYVIVDPVLQPRTRDLLAAPGFEHVSFFEQTSDAFYAKLNGGELALHETLPDANELLASGKLEGLPDLPERFQTWWPRERGEARPIVFDMVFIDGLHEAEQVYRDFANALSWVEDDTRY